MVFYMQTGKELSVSCRTVEKEQMQTTGVIAKPMQRATRLLIF